MKKVDIIILAGQSNAVGVGHVQYLPKHFSGEKVAEFMRGYEKVKINYFSHDKKSKPEDNPDVAHYDCGSIIELGRLFADNIFISIDVV